MKKVLFIFLFIGLTIIIFFKYESIIKNKVYEHNVKQYYDEKNDIDIIFLGSSRVQFSMSPMEIWDKYGIVSYNRGSAGQYYKLSYLFLEEIFTKYQPKIIVFDIAFLQLLNLYNNRIEVSLSNMENNYFKLYSYSYIYGNIKSIMENANTIDMFHYRWKELNKYDFINEPYWKGRYSGTYVGTNWYKVHSINKQNKFTGDNVLPTKLKEDTLKYANMMVDLVTENNSKIIFVKMPYITNKPHLQQDKAFELYAKEKDWDFINYNLLYDEIGLDFNRDFRDKSHLNIYGARKVMAHLIPYIIEHYNISNKKNDPTYASWNDDYKKYSRAINREEIRELKSFSDWKKQAFYDNYTVMISTYGDVLRTLPDQLKNDLKSFGLQKYNTDKPNMRYSAVIDDDKVFFEELSNKPVIYKGRMKNIVNLLVSSDGKATINVSGKPRSKNKYGLNFVIYDKINREIVDSIWIDPRKPDVVRR